MLKLLKPYLAVLLMMATLFFGAANTRAQAVVKVDPNQNWIGYMNVFLLPGNGGSFLFGNPYGIADLRGVFGTTNLTLSPCTNVWETADTSYVQGDGITPAVNMDANFYVQDDSLVNTNIVFIGSCASNTLTLNPEPLTGVSYTSTAFIKIFDAGYALIGSVTTNLIAGQSFSLSLNTTGATHAQYGFETEGPDANPTNTTLGNVVINVAAPSALVTVDPSQSWVGYMNVFELAANGGGYDYGSSWGLSDLRGLLTSSNLTLLPCTNVWTTTNTYYVKADGVTPNKSMDASIYVQNDNLANTNLLFIGTCLSNTLTANPEPLTGVTYTSVAFIKIFNSGYGLIGSALSPGLSAGQPFALSLNTTGAAHVQYGFETIGPDGNPSTAGGLGNVVLSAAVPPTPVVVITLTNAAPTPTHPQSSVLSLYNSSGVYTNKPVERWLASWSGASESAFTIPGTGRTVLKYSNLQYAGVEFYDTANGDNVGGTTDYSINTTPYDTFHVDVWTPNANQFGVQLVSLNPTVGPQVDFLPAGGAITNYGWVSLDIPLTSFTAVNPALVLSHLQQMLWIDNQGGGGFTSGTFYIDNVYFYKSSVIATPTLTTGLSGGNIQLQFPTHLGTTYDVQYKTNLTDAVWQTLQSVSGTGSAQTIPDPANQKSRFYRLYAH